jgi:hypothetical protein
MTVSHWIRRCIELSAARRAGRRDGLRGVPALDDTSHPPALMEIRERGREQLAAMLRTWSEKEAQIRASLGIAELRLEASQDHLRVATRRVKQAENRSRAARPAANPTATTASERPLGPPRIHPWVYRAAIGAILLAEFPLNAIAFRLFGEAEVLTWVMTGSLALTLVLCAHGLGIFLRAPNPTIAERRWVLTLMALPTLAIIAIAIVRERYLSVATETTGLGSLGPVAGSLVFLVNNLLIYTGAAMLSYLAHGPRPAKAGRAERADSQSAQQELVAARVSLGSIRVDMRRSKEQVSCGPVALEEHRRAGRARAMEIRAYYGQLMSAYGAANIRARSVPSVPGVLRELPELEVPHELREIHEVSTELPPLSTGNGHGPLERVAP